MQILNAGISISTFPIWAASKDPSPPPPPAIVKTNPWLVIFNSKTPSFFSEGPLWKPPIFSEGTRPKPPVCKLWAAHIYHFHIWVPHVHKASRKRGYIFQRWQTNIVTRELSLIPELPCRDKKLSCRPWFFLLCLLLWRSTIARIWSHGKIHQESEAGGCEIPFGEVACLYVLHEKRHRLAPFISSVHDPSNARA